jgi:YD repeat-containing protein
MKSGIAIGLLCLVTAICFGQNPPPNPPMKMPEDLQKIVSPTPNAAKITEYYAQRPSMYTGTANVTVPLYTIDFDGWKLPLSLSYNATGVRVSEEASEVGLGWALSATGMISRSVNGGDDFNEGGLQGGRGYVIADEQMRQFKLGYNERVSTPEDLINHYDTSYYFKLFTSKPDTQPDVFNYNFFGYSGSFVLTQQVKGDVKAVKITQDACSVLFDLQSKTFTVITPQGFKGIFDVREMTTTASGVGQVLTPDHWLDCCAEGYIDYAALKTTSGQYRVITSWYLSKIRSPRGKEINFSYELTNGRSPNVSAIRSFPEFQDGGPSPRVCTHSIQEHIYLQTITSYDVQLNFTMEDRDDIRKNFLFVATTDPNHFPAPRKLKRYKSLVIEGNSTTTSGLHKTINFVQSYFDQQYYSCDADTEDEVRFLRSRLDRVQVDDQEYSFFYELPSGLPEKLSTAVDHFGFYNGTLGAAENMLLPPQFVTPFAVPDFTHLPDTAIVQWYGNRVGRDVNFDFGKAGILKKIVYPTRGFSKFTYEPHRYIPENAEPLKEEVFDGNNGNYAGGARIQLIEDFDYNDESHPVLTKEYVYTQDYNAIPAETKTSGRMMTPLYNRHQRVWRNNVTSGFDFIYRTYTGIPGSSAAQGKAIGYSKVHEIVRGKGNSNYRNTYVFENSPNSVLAFNVAAIGTPNLNGQLIRSLNYDTAGNIVQGITNDEYNHVLADPVRGLQYEVSENNTFLRYHVAYNLDRTFINPYLVTTVTAAIPNEIQHTNDNITSTGNSVQVATRSTFNESTWQLRTQQMTNSVNEIVKTEYKRPPDYATPSSVLSFMKSETVNVIDPVIEEIVTRDGAVVSAKGNEYSMDTTSGTFVNLKRSYMWNPKLGSFEGSLNGTTFSSKYELKVTFDKFNEVGKVLQYTPLDGVRHSFVWGYNNTLPIVHGVGIKYDALKAAHDAAQPGTVGYQAAIRNQSTTAGKQITTFEHDPLVGVTSVNNPSQQTTTYKYGIYSRLQLIVDNNGKTLEQYEYNYRQIPATYDVGASNNELDWGTQVPGSFGTTTIGDKVYPGCASAYRAVTISNNGTADVIVETDMSQTDGAYRTPFSCGVITAGNSIEVQLEFNPNNNLPAGLYNKSVRFSVKDVNTHEQVDEFSVAVNAKLETVHCPTTSATVDFGNLGTTYVHTNDFYPASDGNVGYRITGYYFKDTNGTILNPPPALWEYNTSFSTPPSGCIIPGNGTNPSIPIHFKPQAGVTYTAAKTATMVLHTTSGCGDINVALSGWYRGINYWKHMTITYVGQQVLNPIMEDAVTTVVRLTNDGENILHILSMTPSGGKFSHGINSDFYLDRGEHKDITITFSPNKYNDFATYSKTFTFDIEMEEDEPSFGGDKSFTVSGARQRFYDISISPKDVVYDPGNGTNADTWVTNTGNSDLDLEAWYAFATDPNKTFSNATNTNWGLTYGTNPPKLTAPGGQIELHFQSLINSPAAQIVQIRYGKPVGSYTTDDEFTLVKAKRTLSFAAETFPAFYWESNMTRDVTVTNTGNKEITITSAYTGDSDHFVDLDPKVGYPNNEHVGSYPVTLSPGDYFKIPVKFSPKTSFDQLTTYLAVAGNQDSGTGSSVNVTAQRPRLHTLTLPEHTLVIDPTIQGSFNDHVIMDGISTSNNEAVTPYFEYRYLNQTESQYSPVSTEWTASIDPVQLSYGPGHPASITVGMSNSDPHPQIIRIRYDKTNGNLDASDEITISRAKRTMTVAANLFPDLVWEQNMTKDVTVTSTGNTELRVDGASLQNETSRFTIVAGPFRGCGSSLVQVAYPVILSPGECLKYSVRYTPDDYSSHTTTFNISSNVTEGGYSVDITAKKPELHTLVLPQHSFVVDPTIQGSFNTATLPGDVVSDNNKSYTPYFEYRDVNQPESSYSPNVSGWTATIEPASLNGQQQHSNIKVHMENDDPFPQIIRIRYGKTNGNVDASDEITVERADRNITLSYPTPFGTFTTEGAISRQISVYNSGNSPVNISDVTSTNTTYFTVDRSGLPTTLDANSTGTVTVTYTPASTYPTMFLQQDADINFISNNRISGSGTQHVTAKKNLNLQIAQGTDWSITYSHQTGSNIITNSSNVDLVVRSIEFISSPSQSRTELNLHVQFGSSTYTVNDNPMSSAVPLNMPFNKTSSFDIYLVSTASPNPFPTYGIGGTIQIIYAYKDDPSTIARTDQIIVARQAGF